MPPEKPSEPVPGAIVLFVVAAATCGTMIGPPRVETWLHPQAMNCSARIVAGRLLNCGREKGGPDPRGPAVHRKCRKEPKKLNLGLKKSHPGFCQTQNLWQHTHTRSNLG
jgi:hypothetical protein